MPLRKLDDGVVDVQAGGDELFKLQLVRGPGRRGRVKERRHGQLHHQPSHALSSLLEHVALREPPRLSYEAAQGQQVSLMAAKVVDGGLGHVVRKLEEEKRGDGIPDALAVLEGSPFGMPWLMKTIAMPYLR